MCIRDRIKSEVMVESLMLERYGNTIQPLNDWMHAWKGNACQRVTGDTATVKR